MITPLRSTVGILCAALCWNASMSTARAAMPWRGVLDVAASCQGQGLIIGAAWTSLKRDNSERVLLGQQRQGTTTINELTTDQGFFDFEPGLALNLAYKFGDVVMLETNLMGLNDWATRGSISNATGGLTELESPFLSLSGPTSTGLAFDYTSKFNSGDLNLRFTFGEDGFCWMSLLGGFRMINLEEDFALFGGQSNGSFETTRVETNNRLYGAQFGADVNGMICDWLGLSLFGKAGFFANDMRTDTTNVQTTVPGSPVERLNVRSRATAPAGIVEGGANFLVRISDNIQLRGGYHMMFINGLALAPEQLTTNQTMFSNTIFNAAPATFPNARTEINRDGNMLLHGPVVGLELRW